MEGDALVWIAVGSVATALIAFFNLYLLLIKPWWKGPRFSLEFEMGGRFCAEAMSRNFKSPSDRVSPTLWLRVKVRNIGRSVAERCIGKLMEIMDAEGNVLDGFDPTQLLWVSTPWGTVPFLNISLNRGEYEYLDVLVTQSGDDKIHICGDQFVWANYEPRAITRWLEPGNYILHITAYGDNVEPKTKYLSLIWRAKDFKDVSVEIHDSIERAKGRLRQENAQGK